MKTIPLTQGLVTMVDDEDFVWLSGMKWRASFSDKNCVYAYTGSYENKKAMHVVILPHVLMVDHRNGNTLDNQRANLREATQSLNSANSVLSSANTSGFKGVIWYRGKWIAQTKCDQRYILIGKFDYPQDAARAYDAKAIELFGEFARTNQMLGLI